MREIRAPLPLRVKPMLPLQRRAAERLPEQQELSFEMGGACSVTEALDLHAARRLSIHPPIHRAADDTDEAGMKKFEEIAAQVFAAIGFGLTFVFVMLFVVKVVWWTLH